MDKLINFSVSLTYIRHTVFSRPCTPLHFLFLTKCCHPQSAQKSFLCRRERHKPPLREGSPLKQRGTNAPFTVVRHRNGRVRECSCVYDMREILACNSGATAAWVGQGFESGRQLFMQIVGHWKSAIQ